MAAQRVWQDWDDTNTVADVGEIPTVRTARPSGNPGRMEIFNRDRRGHAQAFAGLDEGALRKAHYELRGVLSILEIGERQLTRFCTEYPGEALAGLAAKNRLTQATYEIKLRMAAIVDRLQR